MKRIAICCDGTWNRLDASNVTNVVRMAEAIDAHCADGTPQIVYYDEGVGSGSPVATRLDRFLGGAFGVGLLTKVEHAYRFLVFNYEPGDEIYIFGFSRGAFTARSLAGLIRNCGIVEQSQARRIREAIELYRARDRESHPDADRSCSFRDEVSPGSYLNERDLEWRKKNRPDFTVDSCRRLTLRYLGVWDTVGALGLPNHLWIAGLFNRRHRFHDAALSSTVLSARHAVALDEYRRAYEPSMWDNLDLLNAAARSGGDEDEARYQQIWFPGDHSSVGGGGDVVGLSSAAFLWIAEGAKRAGLAIRPKALELARSQADHCAALQSHSKAGFSLMRLMSRRARCGPQLLEHVSDAARRRWREPAASLPEGAEYRPGALKAVVSAMS